MIEPVPVGKTVRDVHKTWKLDQPITRNCRQCGAKFETVWKPKHFCNQCCAKAGGHQSRAKPETYSVPRAYAPHGLRINVQEALSSDWLIVLSGPTGTGKTCQAHWALHGHLANAVWYQHAGTLGRDWLDDYKQQRMLEDRRLVLDDIGRRMTDGQIEALCLILDHRAGHELTTICTTNLRPQDFNASSPPLASRLSAGKWLVIGGDDRRGA